MLRNNFKTMYHAMQQTSGQAARHQMPRHAIKKLTPANFNAAKRLAVPSTARLLLNQAKGTFLQNMMPKRGFNSKIDSLLESLIQRLPQGNIGYVIVALNTLFYGAYLFWPKWKMHQYFNNFTFSLYGLN